MGLILFMYSMQEYSVSQITNNIKGILKSSLGNSFYVTGEVSNKKNASNGHIYFDLKDNGAIISSIIWGSVADRLDDFNNGDNIKCRSKIDLYAKSGRYSIIVSDFEKIGLGDLHKKFESLKNELNELGYFDPTKKINVPCDCLKVGIVSSKTGAAIQDMLSVLQRRNPFIIVYLYSSKVQGNQCEDDIANGIKLLDNLSQNQVKLDVIMVSRGGGSIEDLWGFNERKVVEAIYNCNTPTISGVGHEIDYTLTDFACDVRAITPSAAAERVSTPITEQLQKCKMMFNIITGGIISMLESKVKQINASSRLLENKHPRNYMNNQIEKCRSLFYNIQNKIISINNTVNAHNQNLNLQISNKNINNILRNGFVYLTDDKNNVVSSKSHLDKSKNKQIIIHFADGEHVLQL